MFVNTLTLKEKPLNKMIKKYLKATLVLTTSSMMLFGCNDKKQAVKEPKVAIEQGDQNLDIWPVLNVEVKKNDEIEAKVSALLAKMTLAQKVAQMIQPEIRDISVDDMRKYGFGSYLNGGGAFPNNDKHATPSDWIKLAEDMYQASVDDSLDGIHIPTMWGTDAVHGHNNVIGATLFPHNIGLGATNNPALIEKIAAITAKEVMVTGIDWVFAPTVAVVRDDRWGRTYEGYSEDPDIVKSYSASIVKGLQGHADKDFLGDERVISTVKHFLGDGGTVSGDDQGDNVDSEQDLFDIHAQGYVGGLTAGSQSVMASFNSWHGVKNHGNQYLLTDVLKTRMGFDGFVVGDWNGHGQIKGCSNESCPQSINAGLDIFMVPTGAWKPLYENTIAQVKKGEIPQARIDDAVSRILRVKFRAGLFDKPSPAKRVLSGKTELIGSEEHRVVAQQAVRESMVLLKNNNNLLPLMPHQNILVAGDGADNIGKQSGGWTITWQGTGNTNEDFPGGSSIYDGIVEKVSKGEGFVELSVEGNYTKKPDVAIVVFGEEPYAEGNGDIDTLEYQRGAKKDLTLLRRLKAEGIKVVSLFISGRPMWVNAELNASDAFVAVWLPGSEGHAVSDVLFTTKTGDVKYDFKGKLSYSWPASANQATVNRFDKDYQPLFPYGFGLTYDAQPTMLAELPEAVAQDALLATERKIFDRAVQKPWRVVLQSGDKQKDVASNVESIGAISFKTMDKVVQEDARSLMFDGGDFAQFTIMANFPEDLRAYPEMNAALVFNVRVEKKPTDNVELAMLCGENCKGGVDITDTLNALTENTWQTVSMPLSCFTALGADFSTIFSPFNLSTKGKLSLSLADISLTPSKVETAETSCSKIME